MTQVTITGRRVYATGTVVTELSDVVEIYPLDINPSYKFLVKFVAPIEGKENHIETLIIENIVNVICYITYSPLSAANTVPVYVARENGRKIVMNFTWQTAGQGPLARRVVHYTVFDGGPENG